MQNNNFKRTVYSIQSFLKIEIAIWGNLLKEMHFDCMKEEACQPQRRAWFDCFNILRKELSLLNLSKENANNVYIIFEYELPRERGRRPDVLILCGNNLIVLEFKGHAQENQAQIDQVKHYARDLRSYHEKSHSLNVVPLLVLAGAKNIHHTTDGVQVNSGNNLHKILIELITDRFDKIEEWFNSSYAPLPSLIQSAKLLFKENSFQQIKQAHSAGIPRTLEKLTQIATLSKNENSHNLALITGIPGAGKTLVGLQFVFETDITENIQKAVFLSGNGPLVQVLQFSLGNTHFIKGVHDFLKEYATSNKIPSEDIIIYDEAQRAWDSEKVSNSHRDSKNAEPTDFINIGNKKSSCLLIGLIGEGQEIHLGEESGMNLWVDAIKQSAQKWKIHCPQKLSSIFKNSEVEIVNEFNLTTSLRTHQANTLQQWVENLLKDKIRIPNSKMQKLTKENYPIYITRDLEIAKAYVKNKYHNEPNKTFGVIASSKSIILPKYGVKNDYNSTKDSPVAQYFADSNHSAYCRNLKNVVTEFACQGLELDMPILAWDADWIYNNGWMDMKPNNKAKDSNKLRSNSYRVLLTRGRDGMIIFVPNDNSLNDTYQVLIDAGCKTLQNMTDYMLKNAVNTYCMN